MSLYNKRGVSAQKEEVHSAVKNLGKGLYKNSFCKIYPDYISQSADHVNIMHSDGAGTKSILAYLYWKETNDISVWEGIAKDAIVMNLDDLICCGVYDNILFSSTIDRNKTLIPGEVLSAIINGSQKFFDDLKSFGINIHYMGGETADVGDVVRTIAVNGTMTARWPKEKIITNEKIKAGNVIVGLAGFGQTIYENDYNSGIGSNGLTSARHDVLNKYYFDHFKESFDNNLNPEVVYSGMHSLGEMIEVYPEKSVSAGKLLLSPTRTFAPYIKEVLEKHFYKINGIIHCSGGGQTKVLKYLPENLKIIKDNLFNAPPIFKIIQQESAASLKEMFEVFNMGSRMEIYCDNKDANMFIETAAIYGIEAQVIGRVEPSDKIELVINYNGELIHYN